MNFLFGKKENNQKANVINQQEFDDLADTIRVVYDQAQQSPKAALDEVKPLLGRIKGARSLDKRQRSILNAFTHDTAGFIYLELNRPEEALSEMEKALPTYEALEDKTPLVNNYLNQSRAWMMRNDLSRTLTSLERGLASAKQGDLPRAEADVLYKLGMFYSLTDEEEKALETFRRGLLLTQQLNDRVATATFLSQLGQLKLQQNELDKAEDYLLSSMTIFEEYHETANLLQTYNQLDQIYRRKDDYPKALEFATKGLELARQEQNRREENGFLQDLGMLSYLKEDYTTALSYGLESLNVAERNSDLEGRMRAYSLLAQVALLEGDLPQAQQYADSGYNLAREGSFQREQAVFLNNFAEIKLTAGDPKAALGYMEQVQGVFRALKDLPTLSALYVRMGDIYLDNLKDPSGAAQQAERAFETCRQHPGELGMFAFTSALRLWQTLAERGFYDEGLGSAGRCLGLANNELMACNKDRNKNNAAIALQSFWLLFVQVLMILVATLQDLQNNQRVFRQKVDEVLGQLKERFGDTFTLDTWADEMYAKITEV